MAIKMYRELAKYYDMEYKHKDYKTESEIINKFIKKYCKSKGKELLDVACGTGGHARYFKKKYKVTGIDLSPGMLALAKKRVKGVKFLNGNMQTFKLKKKFDAITCLFSAFNYNITKAQTLKTLKNFYNHLEPGGIVIYDLFTRRIWRKGYVTFDIFTDKDVKIVRLAHNKTKGSVAKLVFTYYIIDNKENKKYKRYPKEAVKAEETHVISILDNATHTKLAKQAGFSKVMLKSGYGKYKRPVFILVK